MLKGERIMQNDIKLIAKTAAIIVAFFFTIAVAIMLPAGTLSYWQGWVCLASFCTPTLAITIYLGKRDPALLERRVNPTEMRTQQRIMQSIAGLLFFIGLLVLPGIDYRYSLSRVPTLLILLADGIIVAGFLIVFFVFRSNTFTSRAVEVIAEQKIITSGPYGIVRHPMYSGALLIIFALPLSLDSVWGLIPAGLIAVIIIARLLDEEQLLGNELDGYTDYCQTTKWRLLPFIW